MVPHPDLLTSCLKLSPTNEPSGKDNSSQHCPQICTAVLQEVPTRWDCVYRWKQTGCGCWEQQHSFTYTTRQT